MAEVEVAIHSMEMQFLAWSLGCTSATNFWSDRPSSAFLHAIARAPVSEFGWKTWKKCFPCRRASAVDLRLEHPGIEHHFSMAACLTLAFVMHLQDGDPYIRLRVSSFIASLLRFSFSGQQKVSASHISWGSIGCGVCGAANHVSFPLREREKP